MLTVGFDALVYAYATGGIAQYQTQLMTALAGEQDIRVAFAGGYALQADTVPGGGLRQAPLQQRHLLFAVNVARATGWRSDVHHLTAFWRPPFLRTKRTVITVHDMIPERFGHLYPALRRNHFAKARLARSAAAVICPSEAARRDAIEVLKLPPERVVAVHHGAPDVALAEQATDPWFAAHRDRYVMIVGRRAFYKNVLPVLPAIGRALASDDGVRFLAVGGGPFSAEERSALQKAGLEQRSLQRRLSPADLAAAYQHALCVITPSQAEGFGLPVLEGMAHGAPVIASDIPVHREVAGNTALWFEAERPDSLEPVLRQLLSDAALRRDIGEAGRQRAAAFSWAKTATETAAVYRSVV